MIFLNVEAQAMTLLYVLSHYVTVNFMTAEMLIFITALILNKNIYLPSMDIVRQYT